MVNKKLLILYSFIRIIIPLQNHMNQTYQHHQLRPTHISSTSPPPCKPSYKDFNLIQKLHNQNNQLIQQIKYLSKQNQSLNSLLSAKLSRSQIDSVDKKNCIYSNKLNEPYVGNGYTTPQKQRAYSGQKVRQKLLKNRQEQMYRNTSKANNNNKLITQRYSMTPNPQKITMFCVTEEPSFKRSGQKQQPLRASTPHRIQQEQDSFQIAEVQIPITTKQINTDHLLSRSKINQYFPIKPPSTKNNPTEPHPPKSRTTKNYSQHEITFRDKYKHIDGRDHQEKQPKVQRKKTNQPYLGVLNSKTISPIIDLDKYSIVSNTGVKRSHKIYTEVSPKRQKITHFL